MLIFVSAFPGQASGNGTTNGISVSAKSAMLMDQASGRILFEHNSREKLPIASITKVMTAILAIESGLMERTVTVSAAAASSEGSSVYLKQGEKMKLKDLVYGMMLRSGNDASAAIAEAIGGSMSGFAMLMNEKAHLIGMSDTHFTNASGLDHPDHYSTAYDMALLTRYAMNNRQFKTVFATKKYRAPATNKDEARLWLNKNKLLTQYERTTGGKTGYTRIAGRTLISTAGASGAETIVVTLNDGDDWRDHRRLHDWAFANYDWIEVVRKGKIRADLDDFYKNRVYAARSLRLPVTKDEQRRLRKKMTLMKPSEVGRTTETPMFVGRMTILVDHQELGALPLFYAPRKEKKRSFGQFFQGMMESIVTGTGRTST